MKQLSSEEGSILAKKGAELLEAFRVELSEGFIVDKEILGSGEFSD